VVGVWVAEDFVGKGHAWERLVFGSYVGLGCGFFDGASGGRTQRPSARVCKV
jgi:hypothetical protein